MTGFNITWFPSLPPIRHLFSTNIQDFCYTQEAQVEALDGHEEEDMTYQFEAQLLALEQGLYASKQFQGHNSHGLQPRGLFYIVQFST